MPLQKKKEKRKQNPETMSEANSRSSKKSVIQRLILCVILCVALPGADVKSPKPLKPHTTVCAVNLCGFSSSKIITY